MITALLVVVCGGGGAVVRFLVDRAAQSIRTPEFPVGTTAVNLSGSFLLGLLVGLGVSHHAMIMLGTAALGSYTTFSTWMLESHRPAQDGEPSLALLNVGVALVAGLGLVAAGRAVGALL